MPDDGVLYLEKAQEALAGAKSEYANGRYNNCANRCYYACFQAAIAALIRAGIRPSGAEAQWGHAFVQAQFAGQLINRRKLYSADYRDLLLSCLELRRVADYEPDSVNATRVARALRRTRAVVETIGQSGGEA